MVRMSMQMVSIPGSLVAAARRGSPWWIVLAAALLAMASTRSAHAQTTVTLRPSASMVSDGGSTPSSVHLADIADISGTGTEAERLGGMVIIADLAGRSEAGPSGQGWMAISLQDVRTALDAAGVHWGRVALRGSTCTLRFGTPRVAETQRKSPGVNAVPQNPPQMVDVSGTLTMRKAIAMRVAELYAVGIEDLRLAFEHTDEAFLDMTATGRRIDIQPVAGATAVRVPMNIVVYEGDRVTESRVVTVQALLHRVVLTASAPIQRQQAISAEMVVEGRQWLPPTSRPGVTLEQAVGSVAARKIAAGSTIEADDITAPLIAKRGDIVYVHVLSGTVTVRAKARALGNARDGEIVQLKLEGPDQRVDGTGRKAEGPPRIVTARMSGRGRAVMVVDEPSESGPQAAATQQAGQP